jgi:hypothetical protein
LASHRSPRRVSSLSWSDCALHDGMAVATPPRVAPRNPSKTSEISMGHDSGRSWTVSTRARGGGHVDACGPRYLPQRMHEWRSTRLRSMGNCTVLWRRRSARC